MFSSTLHSASSISSASCQKFLLFATVKTILSVNEERIHIISVKNLHCIVICYCSQVNRPEDFALATHSHTLGRRPVVVGCWVRHIFSV